MRRFVMVCATITLLIGLLACSGAAGESAGSATGVLTVGSEEIQISHVYADDSDKYVLVMLSDLPVGEEERVYGWFQLAEGKKVSGITASLAKETKAPAGRLDKVFYRGYDGLAKPYSDAVQFEVARFDGEVLEGRLYLAEPEGPEEAPFSFDVTFSVPYGVKKELLPWEVTITGVDGPEAEAYAAFTTAIMALDPAETKRWVVSERAAAMEAEDAVELLVEVRSMIPKEIAIVGVDTEGDKSTLTVEGTLDDTPGTGTVTLVQQDDAWKVESESWDFKKE